MSFSVKTDGLVNDLITAEYENACQVWGEKYSSLHEGYAVLLEELEEMEDEYKHVKDITLRVWDAVKTGDLKTQLLDLQIQNVKLAIKELAQICAVLKKLQNTLEGV